MKFMPQSVWLNFYDRMWHIYFDLWFLPYCIRKKNGTYTDTISVAFQ